MPLRWSKAAWLALLLAVLLVVPAGRWSLAQVYPLAYREIISRQAREHGLDPFLVAAVIRNESRFRHDVVSSQGARGLMQLMPETARWASEQLRIPYSLEMLNDPEFNIRLGCWYLASLHQEFGGDTVLALAAYNGGRSNVRRWLDRNQWTGEHTTLAQIPFPETRKYVGKVLRDHKLYRWIYGWGQSA